MSRHIAVLSLCLGLIVAACGPTAEDTTTSAASSEAGGPIANCAMPALDPGISGDSDLGEHHVGYLAQYVAIPASQVDETVSRLQEAGADPTEAGLEDVLGEEGLGEEEVVEARACLETMIRVFTIDGDPLTLAQQIRADSPGLLLAPIHAMGEAGHIGFKAGTDPVPIEGSITPPADPPESADFAAVVDSGIHPGTPGLSGNVQMLPLDEEPANAHSHGTFVASIIRQLSPEHRITFARAREIPLAQIAWSDGDPGDTDLSELTTELHVAEAILRIVHRHQSDPGRVVSLNLSLGAYSPMLVDDLAMTSMFLALDIWFQTFPEAAVFAAGGNDAVADPVLPFWPGALGGVSAVGALNDPPGDSPVEIVWDHQDQEVPWADVSTTPRDWIDALAPGSMLVSYTQPEVIAHWSGSSFASAVANGLHLRGDQSLLNNPLRRADVSGLTYWDGTQVLP